MLRAVREKVKVKQSLTEAAASFSSQEASCLLRGYIYKGRKKEEKRGEKSGKLAETQRASSSSSSPFPSFSRSFITPFSFCPCVCVHHWELPAITQTTRTKSQFVYDLFREK